MIKFLMPLMVTGLAGALELGPEASPGRDDYLTLYFDNDLFGGSDSDYTNGVRLSWISGNRELEELGRVQRWLRRISGDRDSFRVFQAVSGFEDAEAIHYNVGFSLTQLMFTPENPFAREPIPGQRPYAGWLALGSSLHVKDEHILNSVEFTLGITGDPSLAEESQDVIHDLRDIGKFNGWDNQIPTEPTFDVSFVQKRRLDLARVGYGLIRVDGVSEWGLRLGSFRTAAQVGGLFRVGYNLPPDFSDPRLGINSYSHRYFGFADDYQGDWSLFLLFGGTASGVAFDASLDGPLFSSYDSPVERRPLVAEVFCGFGVRFRRAELSYAHTWRSEEYDTQRGIADFGSVALRYRF